ncbi:MAG: anthrone oxygenase family protein [Chthoniobacterales bacterium]
MATRALRFFLWISVIGWGIGLGGKLFDLLIVAGAWDASPPGSLALLPYGPRFPMNPGDFCQPLSIVMAVSVVAALVCGWKAARQIRLWLWLPVLMFLIIWAITPTVFWPMIRELYRSSIGKTSHTDAELVQLVRRWMIWDWFRASLIAVGFLASVRAIILAGTANRSNQALQPTAGRSDA